MKAYIEYYFFLEMACWTTKTYQVYDNSGFFLIRCEEFDPPFKRDFENMFDWWKRIFINIYTTWRECPVDTYRQVIGFVWDNAKYLFDQYSNFHCLEETPCERIKEEIIDMVLGMDDIYEQHYPGKSVLPDDL